MSDAPHPDPREIGRTSPSYFTAGWPNRTRRINEALAALAERAINERWHLNAEGSARYDIERARIMRENT